MATLWTSGGKILRDATGKAILCDACPCVDDDIPCSELANWDGAGWYCARQFFVDRCLPVELLEDYLCDPDLQLCTGPYATEAEANEACIITGYPCCPDDAQPGFWDITFSGNLGPILDPIGFCLDGLTIRVDWESFTAGRWSNPTNIDCGGGNTIDRVDMNCGANDPTTHTVWVIQVYLVGIPAAFLTYTSAEVPCTDRTVESVNANGTFATAVAT